MSSKLWGGRFDLPTNKLVEEFNATIMIEQRLCPFDIKGSIAHATMLGRQNIISQSDAETIISGLKKVEQEIENGQFVFSTADEDIHMAIEKRMTEIVGPVGGKLHTGRSRNDQTTLDSKMHMRATILEIQQNIRALQTTIVAKAEQNFNVIMPGYTHLQTGQPILFSHWVMTYFWMLQRDYGRFNDLYRRMGQCPLGAAALAGTTFPIDREFTAKELGFDEPTPNSIDSVSDRDHMIEFNAAAAMCFMHLTRISEELVLFSSQDFKFIELSDDFCTGSSIMPQKKNPDVAEKMRGKGGRVYGNLMAILTIMKGLPLSYNTDMSEDKETVYDSMDTLQAGLKIIAPMIEKMKINEDKTRDAADRGFSTATDMADYLVRKGIPFRDAHHVVGSVVNYCIKHGKKLNQLTLDEYHSFHPQIENDIYDDITLEASVGARQSYGGTAPDAVTKQIALAKSLL
ncbi:argininosuccinate lyase [Budviciaceae bacterium CWB-B4]|uniref:Argininosuccinate lyase n=1 Tax=Limnobaculum xujianqingii TaxID=2738837 RepID=A0A9D7AH79_9GAMM|nr:argininosuccinate lyase [Limnobaculum xujianqingii]MBK5072679.1 argininosuccinate lyase [Limnobaculum xujianqingii]MBK5175988.1 argininosuccinate lyase [Limnobaculum xujianqingii]